MRALTTRWGRAPHRLVVGSWVACLLVTAGCGAAPGPDLPSPLPSSSASQSSSLETVRPSIPSDGVTLNGLGFTYGPLDTFSLPRPLTISTRVDQPNAVTVVMTEPSLSGLSDYLRRALPAAGYTITAQDPSGTMTFTGQGWTGSVTGDAAVAAVTLSPAG